MAMTSIEVTGNPLAPYQVVSPCLSYAEAVHKQGRIATVDPLAFLPKYPETKLTKPAPELPPEIAALAERAMSDDPQVGGLKAGEATA